MTQDSSGDGEGQNPQSRYSSWEEGNLGVGQESSRHTVQGGKARPDTPHGLKSLLTALWQLPEYREI